MKILDFLKKVFLNCANRLKPRATFRWIFSVVAWLLILAYVGFGIYFGLQIYKYKNGSKTIKASTYFYPFPAAMVNGKIIWANSYYKQLGYIEQFSFKTKQNFSDQADLRKKIIDQLTENGILEFQALRYNLGVKNSEVNDAYQKIIDQSGGKTEVKKVLNELYGMSEREFKGLVRQKVLKEKIRNELMAQVQVSHIFIKDEARANDIASQAKNKGDFSALAKQYSEDTQSRDNGGDLGWLSRGQLVIENNPLPEFDNAVFQAKTGDIVGPIKTSAGFEIIKVQGKKGIINENFDSWLGNLKTKVKIWTFIK